MTETISNGRSIIQQNPVKEEGMQKHKLVLKSYETNFNDLKPLIFSN